MRIAFASAVFAAGLIAFAAAPIRSEEPSGKPAAADKLPPATSASIRRLLSEKIDIPKEFRAAPVDLKNVLTLLVERADLRGESLPIVIDRQAFKDAAPDAGDLMEAPISFPMFARQLSFRQILDSAMKELPGDATFTIREGIIVISTRDALHLQRLLERKVAVDFRNTPLVAAIDEICDRSGLSIAVDPRCDEGNKKTVTLQTEHSMTVRGVLESIADIHNLKIVVSPERVTVLPEAIYMKRLVDQVEELKYRREIESDPAVNNGPRLEPLIRGE